MVGRKVLLVWRVTNVVGRERMDEEESVLIVLARLMTCRGLCGSWGKRCECRSWLSQLESRAAAAGLAFASAVLNCRASRVKGDFSIS